MMKTDSFGYTNWLIQLTDWKCGSFFIYYLILLHYKRTVPVISSLQNILILETKQRREDESYATILPL